MPKTSSQGEVVDHTCTERSCPYGMDCTGSAGGSVRRALCCIRGSADALVEASATALSAISRWEPTAGNVRSHSKS